jgi:hypothetical protein
MASALMASRKKANEIMNKKIFESNLFDNARIPKYLLTQDIEKYEEMQMTGSVSVECGQDLLARQFFGGRPDRYRITNQLY